LLKVLWLVELHGGGAVGELEGACAGALALEEGSAKGMIPLRKWERKKWLPHRIEVMAPLPKCKSLCCKRLL
jgi:hypothetical protein